MYRDYKIAFLGCLLLRGDEHAISVRAALLPEILRADSNVVVTLGWFDTLTSDALHVLKDDRLRLFVREVRGDSLYESVYCVACNKEHKVPLPANIRRWWRQQSRLTSIRLKLNSVRKSPRWDITLREISPIPVRRPI